MERETHIIFKKKGKDERIDYITCITCNKSYPSAEELLKDHMNVDLKE
ncbi:MAG: hypothetical protein K5790_10460 [Nitrosopumilus sp.]|nr:hypothetical protein [Nitrosopumilus sp.]MCV0393692.1 hypothetical protein [Nitrosopumilus sp.]